MFLIVFVIISLLAPFQSQAAEVRYNVEYCTKRDFIEKIKLELTLCAPDCPLEVISIIHDHIHSNTAIVRCFPVTGNRIMIFKA